MLDVVLVLAAAQFVPPHVIADFDARREIRFGQVHQVAIDRRAIEPGRHQFLGQLGMAERHDGGPQLPQHGDPRRRAPQAGCVQHRLQIGDFIGSLGFFHMRRRVKEDGVATTTPSYVAVDRASSYDVVIRRQVAVFPSRARQ